LCNPKKRTQRKMQTIDFGIDLGTTNSLIAQFRDGEVEIFKNPVGLKENLPSVVAFRRDRILIGDQARTYAAKQPKDVKSHFKRKMGTSESFMIPAIGQSKTPVELSAFVLKELKTFIHTGVVPEAAVITIPASFDTVQSAATKDAGLQAGLKHVVLLQEPIAASLAYANKSKEAELRDSQWLVYDLGGGTFDVALVKIVEGELRIVDHEGDNYLGGFDFDAALVEQVVVPHLEQVGTFADLLDEMKSESGRYNRLWERLLNEAEEAKVQLSTATTTEIEFEVEDDEGIQREILLDVTRSEFEGVIKKHVDGTAEMVRTILTRNSLQASELEFVLMVGGSTYIPFVRTRIEELLQIRVNCDVDPTTAVVNGAAYFAATREVESEPKTDADTTPPSDLNIKVAFNRTTQDSEELFSAKVEGKVEGLSYRIVRDDGGYDSGLKELTARLVEDLPIREDAYNSFSLNVYDQANDAVPIDVDPIQIAHGKFSVAGQMLPEDISLVKDDIANRNTTLQCLFQKNTILPASTRMTVDVTKTVPHESEEEIRVIVVEGPAGNGSAANKTIGHLSISGSDVSRDILQGTEIDLAISMSESRELTITAHVTITGQEFSQIYTPEFRDVPIGTLRDEVDLLATRIDEEIAQAEERGNEESLEDLRGLSQPVRALQGEALLLSVDDVTDDRYKLEDRKRKLAQEVTALTASKRLEEARGRYLSAKESCLSLVDESGNDMERRAYNEVLEQEHIFLESSNPDKIEDKTEALESIRFEIFLRTPAFLVDWFNVLKERRERLNDQAHAKTLIEAGTAAIAAENFDRLREIDFELRALLPEGDQEEVRRQTLTGIS
jgi:molecular chaperone DnaK